MDIEKRKAALAEYLESVQEAEELANAHTEDGGKTWKIGNAEYMVLTESAADEAAADEVWDSVWAFRASWILKECGLYTEDAEKSLQAMQEKTAEGACGMIHAIISGTVGKDDFIADAISEDGRGAFLSPYDGEEFEAHGFFVYRMN